MTDPTGPPDGAVAESDAAAYERWGPEVLAFVADYWRRLERLPVGPDVEPGWLRSRLPASAPTSPEDVERVLADVEELIVPALTHWQSPNFFAYFPANTSWPSVLADLVCSGTSVNGMSWATSPAATELETHVLDWLVDLCGLPARFRSDGPGGGVIQDTASSATTVSLMAARERAGGNRRLSDLTVYTSEHAHSSIEKGAHLAGFWPEHLRLVPTDDAFALDPAALGAALADDIAAGLTPAYVGATIGTTSSMAIDPLPDIAEMTRRTGAWLHVDAAMAGSAALCEEHRGLFAGLDHADSYTFNPHKWMGVGVDCSVLYVADRASLIDALSITPTYLRSAHHDAGEVIDYRDWQMQLGRRFRSLKVWFVLRLTGAEAIRSMIRDHVEWTARAVDRLGSDPRWVVAAPPMLDLVCVRHAEGDDRTLEVLDAVNESGRALLTRTDLDERAVIRICVGARTTEWRHVEALLDLLDELA
ncbi:MAG: pyridoxal-dependent decarboxylase [Acidimicrobiales bacterium]